MRDPELRFSSRVDKYIRYRPGYPAAVLDLLRRECGLTSESRIADVGSGTGILSELFLQNGNRVWGVEPNAEMRSAAERLLREYSGFHSIAGSAEATTLEQHSADFITAAQAFHWFDVEKARREFGRIIKPRGRIVLVWNRRKMKGTPFLEAYEQLLHKFGTDYAQVSETAVKEERVRSFFGPGAVARKTFSNQQRFDWEGLKGRLLSSSYTPEPGHPNYEPMLEHLDRLFRAHAADGKVVLEYETEVCYGQLEGARTA
jgi:SAM-dependent methyltransferase